MKIAVFAILIASGLSLPALGQASAPVSVSVASPTPVAKIGDKVKVTVTTTNISHRVIHIFKAPGPDGHAEAGCEVYVANSKGKQLGRIDGRAIRAHGKMRHLLKFWLSRQIVTLKPGETSVDFMMLSNLVDLNQPGTYFVKVSQQVLTYSQDGKASITEVPSNTIHITMTK